MLQIPKSIAPVADHIKTLVKCHFPQSCCLDDFDEGQVRSWFMTCDCHELFHQDADRFIGDVFTSIQLEKKGF